MTWQLRVAGLTGMFLTLCLASNANAFHHPHYFYHHSQAASMGPRGRAVSQGVFPWPIVPPLLQLGQQFLNSGNLNIPDLSNLTQPSPKLVEPATRTAIDKTGAQVKKLLDKLDTDLPDLTKGKTGTKPGIAQPPIKGPGED
jgi:hypothetical protein